MSFLTINKRIALFSTERFASDRPGDREGDDDAIVVQRI